MFLLKMKPISLLLVFIGLIIIPLLLGIFIFSDFYKLMNLAVWLECSFIYLYLYVFGYALRRILIKKNIVYPRLAWSLYYIVLIYVFLYSSAFIINKVNGVVMISLHITSMLGMGYALLFCYRAFLSVEKEIYITLKQTLKETKGFIKKDRTFT